MDVKYAKVEYVNFTSGDPTIKLEGDDKIYSLVHLVGMGRVPNPYAEKVETEGSGDKDDNKPVDGPKDDDDEPKE